MLMLAAEIDTASMGETTRALLWVIGVLVTGGAGFAFGKSRKVTLDPNKVEAEKSFLQSFADDNEREHFSLFTRLTACEKDIARITGEHDMMKKQMDRIETKIDHLLQRGTTA